MNCFEIEGEYKYLILQDSVTIGKIHVEIKPMIKNIRLKYTQFINGLKANEYSVHLDRTRNYNVDYIDDSEKIINLDYLYDNAQALFFLPQIGLNKCKLNIIQPDNGNLHSIIYNIINKNDCYIVKTVYPIQSFGKYDNNFLLQYFKSGNIEIVNE